MATKIKDSATAQAAALKLNEGVEAPAINGEPIAPKEKTTSEKLFPEFTTDDGGITNRPIRPYQDASKPLPAVETPSANPQGQTPPAQAPTAPVYLKPEELTGKMVRLKVDGIEQDVPADTLIKTNQLERHLNAQLMSLAAERKQLEDEKKRLSSQPPPAPIVQDPQKPAKQEQTVKKPAEIEALEARLAQLEAERQIERQILQPQIQEAGIKRVEIMAKEKLGTDDFRSYFDRVREIVSKEMTRPEISNDPRAMQYLDSDVNYFNVYKELKIKDLVANSQTTTPAPAVSATSPVLQTQDGAPIVIGNSGRPASIPVFEGSGGVPSSVSPNAGWQATYSALFQRARESNSQDDWMALYRHKMTPVG